MWSSIRIASEFVWLFTAVWAFVATFEPLRSRELGNRPIKYGAVLGIRITSVIAFLLCLVIIVVDLLDLVGVLSKE